VPVPPTDDPVILEGEGAVAVIRLNRPAVLNAIDAATVEAFLAAVRRIASRPDLRAIVLKGSGRAFCAGGDVARFAGRRHEVAEAVGSIIGPLHEAMTILADMPAPSIACLHGAVAGAGLSLALACDLAIAADDARFTLAYARIGATPDASSTWHLPRVVGLRRAKELALLADTIDAGEAFRLGLVNRVVPAERLETEVSALATRLAAGPTAAYWRIKGLLHASAGASLRDQLEAERDAFLGSVATDDFEEGVAAFLAKRPARFTGR
jgi:2-(1,2-epoxy-1,2-dihydrophenyl)acetyl-CoA isomerase